MTLFVSILVVVVVVAYGWYALIIMRKNKVMEALAGIDVQLRQRLDLIPNVLSIARRFMEHERDLMEEITQLRTKSAEKIGVRDLGEIREKFNVESSLSKDMGRLFVSVENYPQLRSNETMVESQRTYTEVEANIAAARRSYNAAVNTLRNAVMIFPGSIFGMMAGVTELPPFFEMTEDKSPISADSVLGKRG